MKKKEAIILSCILVLLLMVSATLAVLVGRAGRETGDRRKGVGQGVA